MTGTHVTFEILYVFISSIHDSSIHTHKENLIKIVYQQNTAELPINTKSIYHQ